MGMNINNNNNNNAELMAQIEALRLENKKLQDKAIAKNKLTLKVSEKGAISIYGLGRFPVTLYVEQMTRLIAIVPEIQAFITANNNKLVRK